MSEAFRLGIRPPSTLAPPDWASENVQLQGSERSAKFDISQTPWMRAPMECGADAHTREVVYLAPTGCGKSTMAEGFIPWVVSEDPGAFLYASQTDTDAKFWVETRLTPALKSCSQISKLWPSDRHKTRATEILFPHMPFIAGGANISNFQEKSVRYIYGDEVWRFKPGMVGYMLKRHHDRWNRKVFLVSQAGWEDDDLDVEWKKTDMANWSFQCSECENFVRYGKDLVKYEVKKIEGKIDPQATANTARLVCPHCDHEYEDKPKVRRDLTTSAKYIPENDNPLEGYRGFRMHRLAIWWIPWKNYVLKLLDAKRRLDLGDVESLKQMMQADDCIPWKDDMGMQRKEMRLSDRPLKGRDPKEKMKNETDRFMTCDKGGDHFWVVIRAWAKGEGSELLFEGYVPENRDAAHLRDLQEKYAVEDRKCLIDIQFDSDKVASWCQQYGWTGIRGNGVVTSYKHKLRGGGTVEKSYSTPKIKEGKTLVARAVYFEVASNPIKDILWRLINGEGLNWTVPADVSKAYRRHMKSEVRVEKGTGGGKQVSKTVWEATNRQNHLWDAEYYNVAAALMNGIFEE